MPVRALDVVAGARPNFVKVAPVLRALAAASVPARLVHTGQHYDVSMSDVFFSQLAIPEPDVHLGVGSGPHGAQTARVLEAFERHLAGVEGGSGGVVVVGDVNSTMACALAAVKLGVPVAHVEAGLRSFDRTMPEEINRVVTDAVADLLLVSEPAGERNLRAEGVPPSRVRYVGNVMIDTLVHELEAARALPLPAEVRDGPYVYVTLHRPSNVDEPGRLAEMVAFLRRVAERAAVVFPLHPRTRARLEGSGLLGRLGEGGRVLLSDPFAYRESLRLISGARLVLTDSGGIQEETSYLGVPCLTLRPNTERPVTVEMGTNTVVGSDLLLAERLAGEALEGRSRRGQPIPGWDGRAAERVVDELRRAWLGAPGV